MSPFFTFFVNKKSKEGLSAFSVYSGWLQILDTAEEELGFEF